MCDTCRAIPKRHRAKAGYDKRLVAGVECLSCKRPIGKEPFVEVTVLERFGTMMFMHKRCDKRGGHADEQID